MLNPANDKSALVAAYSRGDVEQTADQDDKKTEGLHRLSAFLLIQVNQNAAPGMARQLLEEAPQADNQDSNSRLLPLVSSALIQVNKRITSTAREVNLNVYEAKAESAICFGMCMHDPPAGQIN